MARYSFIKVKGVTEHRFASGNGSHALVYGVILYDRDTHYEFFMSRDERLRATGWVYGGFPIALVPDENAWDLVSRYTLGNWDAPKGVEGIAECGCPMLKAFTWEESACETDESRGLIEEGGHDRGWLCDFLNFTVRTSVQVTTFEELLSLDNMTNTDYDCATQVWPDRRGTPEEAHAPGDPDVPREIVSAEYTTDADYTGQHSYHFHHNKTQNRPVHPQGDYLIGVELEVECNNERHKKLLNSIHSNWFYQERDGSLGEYGTEIITVPLRPKDAHNPEFWKPMTDVVSKLATSWDKQTTGLHVHLSRTILGQEGGERTENLGKLLYFWHHIVLDGGAAEKKNAEIYGRSKCYNQTSGKTEKGAAAHALGASYLRHTGVSKEVGDSMMEKSRDDRYHDINITNTATIEFRKGKGSIKPERIAMVVAWSELMCLYCKATRWAHLSFDGFKSYVLKSKFAPKELKDILEK